MFCSLDSPTGDAVPTAGYANANGQLGNTIDNLGTETGSRAGISDRESRSRSSQRSHGNFGATNGDTSKVEQASFQGWRKLVA